MPRKRKIYLPLRDRIIRNVKAYHKNFTDDFINNQSDTSLLSFVHPEDRKLFKKELHIYAW
jgi:hypothetical protein